MENRSATADGAPLQQQPTRLPPAGGVHGPRGGRCRPHDRRGRPQGRSGRRGQLRPRPRCWCRSVRRQVQRSGPHARRTGARHGGGHHLRGPGVGELLYSATIAVTSEVPVEQLWHAVPAFPTTAKSGGGFWRPTGALAGRHSSEGPARPGPIRASPEPTCAGLRPARRRVHAEVAGWSVYEVTPAPCPGLTQ